MTPDHANPTHSDTIIVVHSDFIIASDLSDTIRDFAPAARIVVAAKMLDACAALENSRKVLFAFVEAGHADFKASPLAALLDGRRGRAVLLGDAAERSAGAGGWPVLVRPFFSDDIRLLLV